MIIGIDVGGTNIDVVARRDGAIVADYKVSKIDSLRSLVAALQGLDSIVPLADVERIVVASTVVTNAVVQHKLPRCTNVVIPGPGLSPTRAFTGDENVVAAGCVDHRGRITESVDGTVAPETPVVAITSKFGIRNPELEQDLADRLDYAPTDIALGHHVGARFSFPQRSAAAVANAQVKPVLARYRRNLEAALDEVGLGAPVFFLKGDGGMLDADVMEAAPSHLRHGGPAASTIGLLGLSGVREAVCIDIGGTTTDIARVTDGFLDIEPASPASSPIYESVASTSLPLGGDIRIERDGEAISFSGKREDAAAAFGGTAPTLTDALHVLGEFTDGDVEAAEDAFATAFEDPKGAAERVVVAYAKRVATHVDAMLEATTVGIGVIGGTLAPVMADRLGAASERLDEIKVPELAPVAGAVGCAVARVSLEVGVHIDTARGRVVVSSVGPDRTSSIDRGRRFDTEAAVHDFALAEAVKATEAAGATASDPWEVRMDDRFNVVHLGQVTGEIADVWARIEPGYAAIEVEDR